MAFIFFPLVKVSNAFIIPREFSEFLILIALEFLVGFLIGFVANLLFEGVRMTGNILSIQMGLSMSEALDPATGIRNPEISQFYVYLVTLLFLATGAHQMILICIYNSFQAVPMGVFPIFNESLIAGLTTLFAQLFKIGFGIALPVFSVLLVCDVLLGLMSKTMPQMNVYMVAIPFKIYVGLILIFAFLGAVSYYLQGVIKNYIGALVTLFN